MSFLKKASIAVVALAAVLLFASMANAALTQVTTLFTIDEVQPSSFTDPVDDMCPVGAPCKIKSELDVLDVDQPGASLTTISAAAFSGTIGTSIANGTVVGNTHIVIKYAALGGCSSPSKITVDESDDFVDGGIKGEVADNATQEALASINVWPTRLESDLRVSHFLSTGHPVLRRSLAVIEFFIPPFGPTVTVPINLLSFDVSDGNGFAGLTLPGTYNVAVVGDPSEDPDGDMCTPTSSESIMLGQTAAGLKLTGCEASGHHTMTTVLTREVGGAIVIDANVSDTIDCALVVGGMAEYPDVSEGASSRHAGALASAGIGGALTVILGGFYLRRRLVKYHG